MASERSTLPNETARTLIRSDDTSDADYTYIGEAAAGASESSEHLITRIAKTSAGADVLLVSTAAAAWTDRLTAEYQ